MEASVKNDAPAQTQGDSVLTEPEQQTRGIWALPDVDKFYSQLMDRLHVWMGMYTQKPFTIILNALPRNHRIGERIVVPRFEDFPLIYAGVEKQQELLGEPIKSHPRLSECWQILHNTRKTEMKTGQTSSGLTAGSGVVSSKIYGKFKRGEMKLEDIWKEGMGTLTNYFSPKDEKGNPIPYAIFQEEERIILSSYFNLEEYRYLSVPLIQFAEFDGVVHIIYHQDDHKQFVRVDTNSDETGINTRFIGNIIKVISREYEERVINWDVVGANQHKLSVIENLVDSAIDELFYALLSTNPILRQLGYQGYYKKHNSYLIERIQQSDEVPQLIKQQYRRIAIMSILIDSYTHNISAHSLVALEGWFKQRALFHWNKPLAGGFSGIPLVRDPRSFDIEQYQFARFLLDKGAFWTGLSRDQNFGGKTDNLFNVLWNDFANNPLYLGTIAYTEGILRLNINVTFLEKEALQPKGEGVFFKKKVVADGVFVTIDLQKLNKAVEALNRGDAPELESYFVTKGAAFDELEKLLDECKVYFPAGVVGKHALFTIWENEIRNVKHYPEAIIKAIRDGEEGLTLNISIESEYYPDGRTVFTDKPEYYKIGTWLKHPVEVNKKMMQERLEKLESDIITENYNPKLGGVFQDKVCSAMLFNNSFSAVQNRESERDQRFYPWIKAGFSTTMDFAKDDFIEDIEISVRRYTEGQFAASRQLFEKRFEEGPGHYKKFFHLWRGEDIYHLNDGDIEAKWENLARFRFVYLPKNTPDYDQKHQKLRERGIMRIINQPVNTVAEAYALWLREWLREPDGQSKNWSLLLGANAERKQQDAEIYWNKKQVVYNGFDYTKPQRNADSDICKDLYVVHAKGVKKTGLTEFQYRSHGIFMQHFCRGNKDLGKVRMDIELAAELLETFATRVCVFDRRVAKWFQQYSEDAMQTIGCQVYDEEQATWERLKREDPSGLLRFQFLVIHLSFIENLRSPVTGERYTEETIDCFIEEHLLDGRERPGNFILVITSGRGRKQWRDTIESINDDKKDFTSYVTFRPVESLINAVESSLTKSDDLEMKYQLVKVLIGS